MKRFVAWLALFSATCPALSAEVPAIAVEKTCRAAQERQGAALHTFDACMTDEQNARKELAAGLWDRAKPSTREVCRDSGGTAPYPSYIEMLTCVQLYEGVVMKPADQQ
jgi:hypothetical protein